VVKVLAERGISLAGVSPKPITTELLAGADLVITMSRHPTGPTLPPDATTNSTGSWTSRVTTWRRCEASAITSTSK
jgi:protein-tyrosine-phosphatase